MGRIECYWWKFWRRLQALTEQLPLPVALAGGFEVPTSGSALRASPRAYAKVPGRLVERHYSLMSFSTNVPAHGPVREGIA
jgi:hypothetical protein